MKTLFALIALISASAAFAASATFVAPPAEFQSNSSYSLLSPVKVEVKSVSVFSEGMAKARISLNGVEKEYEAKVLFRDWDGGESHTRMEARVASDLLSDGFCDEYETAAYYVSFTEINEYGHYSIIRDPAMRAVRTYSYDRCHSGMETTEYVYSVKP